MIKQLLVGLGESEYSIAAVHYACDLALIHDATVTGLAVANTAGIEAAYHTPRPMGAGSADHDLYVKSIEDAKKKSASALAKFEEICKERGVKYKGALVEGDPGDEISKASILSDMVVLGRKTMFTCWLPDDKFDDACADVIEHSVRPMVLVPGEHQPIKKIMIALDFQRLSERLYYNFIHLNPYPDAQIHIVHVASSKKVTEFPEELVEYFKVHDLEVKPVMLSGDHVGQALVNYATTNEVDMVVMGVHTMSKVLKALLGSGGRYVLNNLQLPIYTQT